MQQVEAVQDLQLYKEYATSLDLRRHASKQNTAKPKPKKYSKEFHRTWRCLYSMYISYLSVNGPFVLALQKRFRIKFEVNKNGDKTKGWRERDDGEISKGESITDWHCQVLSWTMNTIVQVKNRNDLNSVGFPQSLNSTAWGNVISQTFSVVLDYLQLGRFDSRKYIFFSSLLK